MSFVNPYIFGPPIVTCTPTDPDVIAYLTATGIPNDGTKYYAGTYFEITGREIWCAVDEAIIGIKSDGVWAHLDLLSINLGPNTNTQKYNAVNPLDTDGAYRLSYNGSLIYVDHDGIHFSGVDDYVNTHYRPLSNYDKFFFGVTQRSDKSGRVWGTNLAFGSLSTMDFKQRSAYNGWVFPGIFATDKSQVYLSYDRKNVNEYDIYVDEDVTSITETVFGTPSGNYDFYVGAYNDTFGSGASDFAEACISTIFAGRTMNAVKHKCLKDRLYTLNNKLHRTQRNAYFYGDSITQGANSTVETFDRWTKLLSDAKYLNEINYGLSGRVLEDTTPNPYPPSMVTNSTTIVPTKTSDDKYVFIAYGVNDANYISDPINYPNYSVALFTTQLGDIIDNITAKGWSASDIVLITGYKITAGFNTQYQLVKAATISVGNSKGCQVIDLSGLSYLPPDNVHPNNAGHAEIAAYVASQLV